MSSTSPPTRTSSINAFGAKITRAWSWDSTGAQAAESEVSSLKSDVDEYVPSTLMTDNTPRSRSRGREHFSTGRGGAGNIHNHSSPSRGADGTQTLGGYDHKASPAPRGREPIPVTESVTHVGRGGAGNIRGASRPGEGISAAQASYEQNLIERYDENQHTFSTGRGGAGNILPSQPLLASRVPPVFNNPNSTPQAQDRGLSGNRTLQSTGRGGAGNITSDKLHKEDADEHERRTVSPSRHYPGEAHSTGRGGLANVTTLGSPSVEVLPAPGGAGLMSTGRGGAGNIASRDRTRSPTAHPGAEGERNDQSMMEKIMEKLVGRIKN